MASLWMGFNCLKARATLERQFSFIKFTEIPGTHFWTSEGWKTESTLEPPSGFEHGIPVSAIQRLKL